ncbi:MAG: hypothetical protein FGM39_06390 [Phycisphaerales bacterium]|nr:hypothetical protein [Phycisphaerales bacterium]
MRTRAAIAALLLASIAPPMAGCATTPEKDTYERRKLKEDMVIAMHLMDLADLAYFKARNQYIQALVTNLPSRTVAAMSKMQAGIGSTTRAMAVDPNPRAGLVHMYTWVQMARFSCANRIRLAPETMPCGCDDIFGKVSEMVRKVAVKYMTAEQLAELDRMIAAYQAANPDLLHVGLLRVDDIATSDAAAALILPESEETMLSPVTDAAHQLELTRFLGNQLVWLAARLPNGAADDFDSVGRLLLESGPAHQAVAGLGTIGAQVGDAAARIEQNSSAQRELATQISALGQDVRGVAARAERIAVVALGVAAVLVGIVVGWAMRARRRSPAP